MVSQINMLAWVGMRERSRHSGREQPHGDREGCQPLLTPFGMPISRVHSNAVGNGDQIWGHVALCAYAWDSDQGASSRVSSSCFVCEGGSFSIGSSDLAWDFAPSTITFKLVLQLLRWRPPPSSPPHQPAHFSLMWLVPLLRIGLRPSIALTILHWLLLLPFFHGF